MIEYVLTRDSLGQALVGWSTKGICWLALGDDADTLERGLRRRFPAARRVPMVSELAACALLAIESVDAAAGLPLDLRGTLFQLEVWAALQRIPRGSVITYAELAHRVGRPGACRAAAQACAANPVGVLVPCHRVIASDGGLGGFGFGMARKLELLRREGGDREPE